MAWKIPEKLRENPKRFWDRITKSLGSGSRTPKTEDAIRNSAPPAQSNQESNEMPAQLKAMLDGINFDLTKSYPSPDLSTSLTARFVLVLGVIIFVLGVFLKAWDFVLVLVAGAFLIILGVYLGAFEYRKKRETFLSILQDHVHLVEKQIGTKSRIIEKWLETHKQNNS